MEIGGTSGQKKLYGKKRIRMNKITITLLSLLYLSLFSQIVEQEILLKKAEVYNQRQRYEQANEIYITLLEDYSVDFTIAAKLIFNYLRVSKVEKAESVLFKYQDLFPEIEFSKTQVLVLLRKGELKKASDLSGSIIKKNKGNVSLYRDLSSFFEQANQYRKAIDIMLEARKITKDDHLYAKELAFDYHKVNDLSESLVEYLKHLEKNKSNFHFVLSRIKKIMSEDRSQIKTIEKFTGNTDDKLLQEIYAISLAEVGEYDGSLEIFETLEIDRLKIFVEENMAVGNFEIAKRALKILTKKEKDPGHNADLKIQVAQIQIYQNEIDSAEVTLLDIYHNQKLSSNEYRYRTQAGRICREMLAGISMRKQRSGEIILKYLEEAKDHTFNQKDKKEIELTIIHFLIMNENYDLSRKKMESILQNEDQSTDIYKLSNYYSFLIATMQNDNAADSLLGELVISFPSNELTNDALFLSYFLANFDPQNRESFLEAYREKMLLKNDRAIELLSLLYNKSKFEEILFLCGEWAMQNEQYEKAKEIFSFEYEDELFSEYAQLKLAGLSKKEEKERIVTGFLTTNPQSVFSPEFRKLLNSKEIENKE